SEEHTSELQSRFDLVCRLLLEKKKSDADPWTLAEAHGGADCSADVERPQTEEVLHSTEHHGAHLVSQDVGFSRDGGHAGTGAVGVCVDCVCPSDTLDAAVGGAVDVRDSASSVVHAGPARRLVDALCVVFLARGVVAGDYFFFF